MGNHVEDYLKAISKLRHPRKKRHASYRDHRGDTGVEFKAENIKLLFFDEYLEAGSNPLAQGLLRMELQYNKRSTLSDHIHVKDPRLTDLTDTEAIHQLNRELKALKILGTRFLGRNTALKSLVDEYGKAVGHRYYAVLKRVEEGGARSYLEETGRSDDYWRNLKKRLSDDGISPVIAEHAAELSPLRIRIGKSVPDQKRLNSLCITRKLYPMIPMPSLFAREATCSVRPRYPYGVLVSPDVTRRQQRRKALDEAVGTIHVVHRFYCCRPTQSEGRVSFAAPLRSPEFHPGSLLLYPSETIRRAGRRHLYRKISKRYLSADRVSFCAASRWSHSAATTPSCTPSTFWIGGSPQISQGRGPPLSPQESATFPCPCPFSENI